MDLSKIEAAAFTSPTEFWSVVIVITALSAWIFHQRTTRWRVTPKGFHGVPSGVKKNSMEKDFVARTKAHMLDFRKGTDFVMDGYEKYSKNDKPFVVPSFVTWQPEVVLPPSQIRWLVEQPDTVLSIDKCLLKDLEFPYTTPAAWSFTRPFHVEAINKLKLDALVEDMADEVQAGIDEQWGSNTEDWTTVNIEHTMMQVLVRITSRVFVGPPLCRDKSYIDAATEFMTNISVRSIMISFTPEIFRPLVAWWMTRDLRRWNAICTNKMRPLVEKEMMHRRPSDQKTMPAPVTLLEQLSRLAVRSTHKKDRDAFSIGSRLLALNFVAVHTSNAALINALVDIASPPATTKDVFRQLREEAEGVSKQHHGNWSKSAVGQLVKTDSMLRESLRLNTFKSRGVERIVVKKEGVVLPSGQYLKKGTKIGLPVLPIHRDSDIYDEALTLDAFRFCGSDQTAEKTGGRTDSPARSGHVELINTSESFLAFGHGKHACPGRFLAAYELKLIMAYITMHYEIEPFSERPENGKFSDFQVGIMHDLRVRRRKV